MNDVLFKPVVGFEKWYEVGSDGSVVSLFAQRGKPRKMILKAGNVGSGYAGVMLCNRDTGEKRYTPVHRIVGIAFIENPGRKSQINHKDGNKRNNRVDNLEWVTASENSQHAVDNGMSVHPKGSKSPLAKLTESTVIEAKRLFSQGFGISHVSRAMKMSKWTASDIKYGKRWAHVMGG